MAVGLFLITWEFPHLSKSLRPFYLKNSLEYEHAIQQVVYRIVACRRSVTYHIFIIN